MLKKIIHLALLAILSIVATTILYFRSIQYGFDAKNGFRRNFLQKGYIIYRHTLPYNSYYLAGATNSSLYLGNVVGTTKLLTTDSALKNYTELEINIPDAKNVAWQALQTKVDFPQIVTAEQITPRFFKGVIPTMKMESEKFVAPSPITSWQLINGQSYVVRMYDTLTQQYDLFKFFDDHWIVHANPILQKQSDGTFSIDGQLLVDKMTSKIVYSYYYRNEILILDTNLLTKRLLRTIDTVTQSNIQVASINSTKTKTLKYPALIINKRAAIYNNRLYIHSLRRADNQSENNRTVIDCYDLQQLKYLFSFYLDIEPKALTGIMATSGRMYAIAGRELFAIRLIP